MTAYIEYVIIDNFTVTALIAVASYKFMLKTVLKFRTAVASTFATVCTVFYPFITLPVLAVIYKIALAAALCFILFFKVRKPFLLSGVFLLATFLFGGCVFAVNFIISGNFILSMNAGMTDFSIGLVIIPVFMVFIIVKRLAVKFNRQKNLNSFTYKFKTEVFGVKMELYGLLDTGNSLYDPLSGLPVVVLSGEKLISVMDGDGLIGLFSGRKTQGIKPRYMNYRTASGTDKILLVKPEYFILYFADKENILNDVTVGITFSSAGFCGYDALLHPALV